MLCDVLHHVPVAFRQEVLDAIRATLAPGGAFVLKEWERTDASFIRSRDSAGAI